MKASSLLLICMPLAAFLAFSNRFSQDAADKTFVRAAADGGMLEVKLGELAQKRATMPKCKDFAGTMISDHTGINDELKALARKK